MLNNTELTYQKPEITLVEINLRTVLCESPNLGGSGNPGGSETLGLPEFF